VVNPDILVEVGLTQKSDKYVAILGTGEINVPLNVTAHKFSASAQKKIEAAGGTVTKIEVKRGGYRTR
jgi:large subunit ribosomal protein L15